MKQSKILLDTCSYLRLAKSIHPLLNQTFGNDHYCLYVIEEFQKEYDKNLRLRNKFAWVNDTEYLKNRKEPINISRNQKVEIEESFDLIVHEASENISKIDIKYLAYADILKIPLVTDDGDMLEFAKDAGIITMTTLNLLKLKLDTNYISIDKVRETVVYWSYISDLPKNFHKDYKILFGENPPK